MSSGARRWPPLFTWSALGVGVVAAFAVIGAILSAVAPAPSGPPLSSYATTARGLAAWAELLQRDGHAVRQVRRPLTAVSLPADATLVVLGNTDALSGAEAHAIAQFVRRGGWLVVKTSATGAAPAGTRGRVVGLEDPSFLENDELARQNNAFRALSVVGPRARPVYFDEAVHGYGPATGLAALPERWWFAFGLLALAVAAFATSRALRLGGSDPLGPDPGSPRTAYVEALAETLVRTTDRSDLVRRVEQAALVENRFRGSL